MATGGHLRVVAVATALTLVLGGCGGIKARKARADRIIDSVDRAMGSGSAQLSVSQKVELRLDRADALVAGGGAPGAAQARTSLEAQADLAHDRVAYLVPSTADAGSGGAAEALRIYSGTTIYARRIGKAATTSRPWVRLELTSLDPDDIHNGDIDMAGAVNRLRELQAVENPLFLLKLLRGTLSGSVDEIGKDEVRGVPTTHYRLNIDREKAFKDEDEDVQDAYEAVFKSMLATATVLPAEVWLDDAGVPRKYVVTFKTKARRKPVADFHLTVELFDVGRPVTISLPGSAETANVDGLGALTDAITSGAA